MARIKFTTTFDGELLRMVREKAEVEKLDGACVVIEQALRLYFANCSTEVWEKQLKGGWLKKLIVRRDRVVFESIRIRKSLKYNSRYHTEELLEAKGWKKVWACRDSKQREGQG